MKPRDLHEPGDYYEYNDVRVNRMALSLLRIWNRPLPDVLKTEIMDPIDASSTWTYHGYENSTVDVAGKPMKSVSGGTRFGGGLWMSSRDHARFGLLLLRHGQWNGKQIISKAWIHEATTPKGKNPGYGYLWWLNTETSRTPSNPDAPPVPTRWPAAPASSFAAIGAGNNTIWIDPEHDLVVVWRWHKGDKAQAEFYKRILQACKDQK
jgi:CubicO group peptidase (beta-lactamase class C family)